MRLFPLPALPHPHHTNDTCHRVPVCPAKLGVLYCRITLVSFILPAPYTADDNVMKGRMSEQTTTVQFPVLNLRGGDEGHVTFL